MQAPEALPPPPRLALRSSCKNSVVSQAQRAGVEPRRSDRGMLRAALSVSITPGRMGRSERG